MRITTGRESASIFGMPIDALPNDLDALRALVSQLTSERDVAIAESRRLTDAFTASSQLRPMAQQLVSTHNAAAYAGVSSYASTHTGEASAAGYLALGHAYSLDRPYQRRLRFLAAGLWIGHAIKDLDF